jgi:HD superfamily phosphohydrolase YqeK
MIATGGGLLACGLLQLAGSFRRQAPPAITELAVKKSNDVDLIDLAQQAGWMELGDEYFTDLRHIFMLWRSPHPLTSPDCPLRVNSQELDVFYNEYVRTSVAFRKNLLYLPVIIQLLELLDRHRNEPSVVLKNRVEGDRLVGDFEDDKYSESSYKILARVTLYAHTLNVAKHIHRHLTKEKLGFRIPSAMVAALAHDLGKAQALRAGRNSREHPAISCEVLHSLPGFDRLRTYKEILRAVRHHHTGTSNCWLSKLLQSADHEARKQEHEEQIQQLTPDDIKMIKPGPLQDQNWVSAYSGPALKDMVPQIPIETPKIRVRCDHPPIDIYEEETSDTDVTYENQLAVQPDDNGQTLRDPLLAKVVRWVEQTDLEDYSPEVIAEEFQISATRAEALFDALMARGVLDNGEASTANPAQKTGLPPSEPAEKEDAYQDLRTLVPESDVVFLPKPKKGSAIGPPSPAEAPNPPLPVFGQKSVLDVPDDKAEDPLAEDYAEITPWFDADRFLSNLRTRINVDRQKLRSDKNGHNTYWQAVSIGKELYVHMYGFKEIVADLMSEYGDVDAARQFLENPRKNQEKHQEQGKIINLIMRYFRDNGGVNCNLVLEGCTGMWCHIEVEGVGYTKREWMLPFLLDELYPAEGDAEELRLRKNPKVNPKVCKIKRITPEHLLGVCREAGA